MNKFGHDKLFFFFLLMVLALGIFIRLHDFSKVGYWNDDMTTIPTGLLAFYPHSFYPGLAGQGEPILGNLIIAGGCLLSDEDFSQVSEIRPMFYPGREILIGEQLINAFPYCHLPIYFFGILFFLAITLLALILLPKYSALFTISFYAFYPHLLQLSRWIHVDIIGYSFIIFGLIFLWKAYNLEKNKKEILFFILSFLFFGLAFATKLPNGLFSIFAIVILIDKYNKEILQFIRKVGIKTNLNIFQKIKYDENLNYSRPIQIMIYSFIIYVLSFLAPLNFNPKNILDVIKKYQVVNPTYSTLSINTEIFQTLSNFLLTVNVIDIILFIFSLVLFIKLIRTKKDKKIKFIFYLFLLLLFALPFFKTLIYPRIFIIFSTGLIFLTSLLFSDEDGTIFRLFKIKNKRLFFIFFLMVYITFSFVNALSYSPHFETKNPLLCPFTKFDCELALYPFVQKNVANFLYSKLDKNETFLWEGNLMIHYYIEREQGLRDFLFSQEFFKKFNKYPTIQEKIQYFHPNNKIIRYIIIRADVMEKEDNFIEKLRTEYIPNSIIYSGKQEAVWIYDIQNLTKK